MSEILLVLDIFTAALALYSYHKRGFWFYGMLSYVALCLVAVFTAEAITQNFHLYSDTVSIRWLAIDAGLVGYMVRDLISKKLPCVK